MENNKVLPITMNSILKDKLKNMSDETGINQANLIRMALHSLLANYEHKGSFIFADLLNPEYKK